MASPEGLKPLEQDDAVLSTEDGDRLLVTFGLDDAGGIISKELELQAPPPPTNSEGRDQFATYKTDDQGRVELSWWDPSDGQIEWSISRDGSLVSVVSGGSFVDQRPDVSAESTYVVDGARLVEVDGATFVEPFTSVIVVPALDIAAIGQTISESTLAPSANTDVQSDALFVQDESAAARGAINQGKLNFQVNTFIPDQFVNGPWNAQLCPEQWVAGGAKFGGDNRGFAASWNSEPGVRTGVDITYSWLHPLQLLNVTNSKRTSGTKLYSNDGTLLQQKKANLSNVNVWDYYGDDASRAVNIIHQASDPMCVMSSPIWYDIKIFAENGGQFRVWGDHTQAPSYEIRTSVNNGSWWNFYEFSNKGFEYLFPVAPRAHIDINGKV